MYKKRNVYPLNQYLSIYQPKYLSNKSSFGKNQYNNIFSKKIPPNNIQKTSYHTIPIYHHDTFRNNNYRKYQEPQFNNYSRNNTSTRKQRSRNYLPNNSPSNYQSSHGYRSNNPSSVYQKPNSYRSNNPSSVCQRSRSYRPNNCTTVYNKPNYDFKNSIASYIDTLASPDDPNFLETKKELLEMMNGNCNFNYTNVMPTNLNVSYQEESVIPYVNKLNDITAYMRNSINHLQQNNNQMNHAIQNISKNYLTLNRNYRTLTNYIDREYSRIIK